MGESGTGNGCSNSDRAVPGITFHVLSPTPDLWVQLFRPSSYSTLSLADDQNNMSFQEKLPLSAAACASFMNLQASMRIARTRRNSTSQRR